MAANAKPKILYKNIFDDKAVHATSENSSFPAEWAVDDDASRFWKASAAGTAYIQVDAGTTVSADAISIAQHNLFTAAADVSIEKLPGLALSDDFADSSLDTGNFTALTAGAGSVTETTSLALSAPVDADAAALYDDNSVDERKFATTVRHKAEFTPTAGRMLMLGMMDKATAPAVIATDPRSDTNLVLMVEIDSSGNVSIAYRKATDASLMYWVSGAWQAGAGTAYAGATATVYNVRIAHDGTTYTISVKDSADSTTHVTATISIASVQNSTAYDWYLFGDYTTVASFTGSSVTSLYEHSGFGGTPTEVLAAFTPTADTACAKEFASDTSRYWQVKIVTASVIPYVGFLKLGVILTMPYYISQGYNPRPDPAEFEAGEAANGNLLGVVQKPSKPAFSLNFRLLTDTWINTYWYPAWNTHIRLGRPFFWIWELTNHSNDVYVVRVAPGQIQNAAFTGSRRTLQINLIGLLGL